MNTAHMVTYPEGVWYPRREHPGHRRDRRDASWKNGGRVDGSMLTPDPAPPKDLRPGDPSSDTIYAPGDRAGHAAIAIMPPVRPDAGPGLGRARRSVAAARVARHVRFATRTASRTR